MMWGMIPPWHKGEPKSHGLSTNNCRLEGMIGSKLYGRAFSKGNRCVIVCDGFYEWQTTKGKGNKQPYFIYMPQPEGGEVIYSYTLITTESNETLSWLHHRAPAILYTEEQIDSWLDYSSVKSEKALHSIKPVKSLVWHAVSTLVNNSRNKDTNCNKPVSLEKSTANSASSMFMKAWLKKPETKVKREISEAEENECSKDINDKSKRIKTDLGNDLK
uniref:Abasic site processing protein HMCES n=1 Tax=Timema poppense TaxID=170557 RepID=A0A7R9H9E1_TIMPO|nr:unnamed protein product [Timema poppensis]